MSLSSKIFFILVFAFFSPAAVFNIHAQNGLGGIAGKIMGGLQPLAGADVALLQQDKIIDKTTTDEDGNYSFPLEIPGHYDVKASKQEYRTTIIVRVPMYADCTTKNDLYLGKFNNAHMPKELYVEAYGKNHKIYMRNR